MAIAIVDAAVIAHTGAGGASSITQSYTVTAGVSVLVVVQAIRLAAGTSVSGVTWNAGAMTAAGDDANLDEWCQCHVLTSPTSGTHDIVASWSAARRGSIVIFTLSGVNTSTPTRTSAGSSSLSSGSATTVANDFCVAVGGQKAGAVTDPASFTNLASGSEPDALNFIDAAYIVAAGITQAANFGGTTGDFAGSLIVPFIPAGAGASSWGAQLSDQKNRLVSP